MTAKTLVIKIVRKVYRDSLRKVVVYPRYRRSIINDYMRRHSIRKLQLFAGPVNLSEWLNTDIVPGRGQAYLNVLKPFPIPTATFQYIACEHGFEHITYDEGQAMLRECYRILVPGGRIRISTPNLLRLLDLFKNNQTDEQRRFVQNKLEWEHWNKRCPACSILNSQLTSFGHKFVYDPETLKGALEDAGFRDVREFPVGESDVSELRGVEARHHHSNQIFRDMNFYETMVMQAVRPEERCDPFSEPAKSR